MINTNLPLLHAAATTAAGESPTVVRVGDGTLFRHDVDDNSHAYWNPPAADNSVEALPNVVTVTDRHPFGGLPIPTFTTALGCLDQVESPPARSRSRPAQPGADGPPSTND